MSTNRSRRIDHDTAEHLLGAAAVGTPGGQASLTGQDDGAGHDALTRLLAAAAAPAAGGELPGEAAALAAFRAAARPAAVPDPARVPAPAPSPVPAAPIRRRPMATAAPAKAFSVKAAVVALLASALGGVAVAAGTGNLPPVLGGPDPAGRAVAPVVPAPATSPAAAEPSDPAAAATGSTAPSATRPAAPPARPSARPTGRPGTAGPSAPADGTAAPERDEEGEATGGPADVSALLALCQDLADSEDVAAALRALAAEPQYAPLLRAVGTPEKVKGYCTAAAAARRSADPDPDSSATAGTGTPLPSPALTAGPGNPPGRSDPTSTRR